jgi:hypothetical protein
MLCREYQYFLTNEGKQVMYKTENPKEKMNQETSTFK